MYLPMQMSLHLMLGGNAITHVMSKNYAHASS